MSVDISAIPQFARNIQRVVEIASILAKYGFADWLDRIDRKFVHRWLKNTTVEKLAEQSHEVRIRLVITELGTTFIKLGQMLSTRRDMIGPALAEELTHLQANVPADDFEVTKATIETELKQPLDAIFAKFTQIPLASASIGQVHLATLKDGRAVAVKVQHPDIEKRIRNDLSLLHELAHLAEEYISELKPYRPKAVVAEFERVLIQELDFRRECRFLQMFNRNFEKDQNVQFPVPVPELSTAKVLIMSFLTGTSLAKIDTIAELGCDFEAVAYKGARVFLDMIFRDGFYHADPHPGNILILQDGVIGILDGGMVGRIDPVMRTQIEAGVIAVMSNDPVALADLVVQVCEVPPKFDLSALQGELAEKISFYWGMPLDQFQLGSALDEFTEAIRRFHIMLPPPLAMLLKTLVMLEGTTRLVSTKFNLVEVLEPYRKKFFWKRFNRRNLKRVFLGAARDWEEIARGLPRTIRDMMHLANRQNFAIQLQHQHLEPSVNRLVFGMMVSSLFVGSALLWSRDVPPTIFGVSVLGALGCFCGIVFGYRLFRAIQKSGKLEDE